jgi:uncharacterized protein (TIGR01777 family)
MRIVVAGGSGFLGSALVQSLAARGDEIVVLTRSPAPRTEERVREVAWVPDGHPGPWSAEIDGADAVVNLAAAGIADRRWSQKRRVVLLESRVLPTRSLVASMRKAAKKPRVFIQQSAIGFYGASETATFDESCPPGADALGSMAVAWEAEAHPASALDVRLVLLRTGIVLARHGGALKKMIPPFLFFVGGPLASGRQVMSWIHLDDWLALVRWTIDTPTAEGVYNATSPAPVSNREFAAAIGRALGRPSWLRVPGFVLRIIVGPFAPIGLTQGQRVLPRRVLEAGFTFRHPTIGDAMKSALAPTAR